MSVDDKLEGGLDERPEEHLSQVSSRFLGALELVRRGDVDGAAEELRAVLRVEPRLAEPRLELARLLIATDQLEEAAEQAQEAVRILESGGRWTDELSDEVILSLALDLQGEALRLQADRDEIVFANPERWLELVTQARACFQRAAQLDPDNDHAAWWAGGVDSAPAGEEPEDEPEGELDDSPLEMHLKWPLEDERS